MVFLWIFLTSSAHAQKRDEMMFIPAGEYVPFLKDDFSTRSSNPLQVKPSATSEKEVRKPIRVSSFLMDRFPVTNGDFLSFVKTNPQWKRSQIKRIFAEQGYLKHWLADDILGRNVGEKTPVTNISWFAANAYCEWRGKSLPTVDQWEYVANDQGKNEKQRREAILKWYSKPPSNHLPNVGSAGKNSFGISDTHGLIWEWTLDFNDTMVANESTTDSPESGLFCGAGGTKSIDPSNYAAFMRYAFRKSLRGNYTISNLGFRCMKENNP